MKRSRWIMAAGLCAAGAFSSGCLPTKLSIDLAPQPPDLEETKVLGDSSLASDKIVLIDVDGLISHTPNSGLFTSRGNSVDNLVCRLAKAEDDGSVKAIVLRVNSPGGTVAASETMYQELRGFRQRSNKPVIVSMAEVAASGGYYISLAADRIVAQETTITGSIGVIIQTMNFSKGMAMIGVEGRAITSGKNKDLANPFAPMRDEQYAVLQGTVEEFYKGFKGRVLERRPALASADPAKIDAATDGRIFTGRQALELGLIDELGGLRESFEAAKQAAGLQRARLVKYHGPGDKPLSAYAAATAPNLPAGQAGTSVSLVELNMQNPASLGSGFMYLWSPSLP